MSYAKLLDSIIQKQKDKKTKSPRRMEQKVFKMIVEMAYEMKYANRYCEAVRTNRFVGVPPSWNTKWNKEELPFEIQEKDYDKLKIGDIVINPHFPRNYDDWVMTRIAKVIRINKVSISLADCDQDGQLIEYNPDEDADYPTKEARKDYNKVFSRFRRTHIPIITGTKHLRYEGWNDE
jgi:hypothetical protein